MHGASPAPVRVRPRPDGQHAMPQGGRLLWPRLWPDLAVRPQVLPLVPQRPMRRCVQLPPWARGETPAPFNLPIPAPASTTPPTLPLPPPAAASALPLADGKGVCDAICNQRRPCGHGCPARCHGAAKCPTDPCREVIALACVCGTRIEHAPCGYAGDGRAPKPRTLECNDACALVQRNRLLAEALDITAPSGPRTVVYVVGPRAQRHGQGVSGGEEGKGPRAHAVRAGPP